VEVQHSIAKLSIRMYRAAAALASRVRCFFTLASSILAFDRLSLLIVQFFFLVCLFRVFLTLKRHKSPNGAPFSKSLSCKG